MANCQIPDTWQPIPKEDLALKDNPADPGASAMILERQTYTDDEKRLQTEWVRIKVFTEQGKDYADIQIPYLARSTSVEGIRGRTVRADGTVIPFNGAAFDTVLVKYKRFRYDEKTFTLPGVDAGSIIEYAYTIRWKDKLPSYVRNPGYIFEQGWTIPSTTWTMQQGLFTRHAVFVLRPVKNGHLAWARVRLQDGGPSSSQSDGTVRMEMTNISALDQEDFMPPESWLTDRIYLYYQLGYVGNYWSDWGKTQAELAEKYLEKTKFLEREAERIAPPPEAPESRLRKLYARVQQIRNLSYDNKTDKELRSEHLPDNKSAEDAYRHGYGDGNEINLLFTALARAAGFDASIVMGVSRDSGLFEEQVPDGTQLNSMVVQVRLNGKKLYLDPATRYCPFGFLPWFETNTGGVRWDKLGGEIVHVPDDDESSSLERTAELELEPDGTLEGNVEATFTRHEAMKLRWSGMDADEAGRKKLVEEKVKAWLPPGTAVEIKPMGAWEDAEQPLRIQLHFRAPHFGALSSKRMLLPISVFQTNNEALLPQVYRRDPVYFSYGSSGFDKVTISLPQGYRMEAAPSDKDYASTVGVFHFKRAVDGEKLRLERRTVRKAYYFPLDNYMALRQYYEGLRQQDAENVVLHRIENEKSK